MTHTQHRASIATMLVALVAPISAVTGTVQVAAGLWLRQPIQFADGLSEVGREIALALTVGWSVAGLVLTAIGAIAGLLAIAAAVRVRYLRTEQVFVVSAIGGAGVGGAAPVLILWALFSAVYGMALASDILRMITG